LCEIIQVAVAHEIAVGVRPGAPRLIDRPIDRIGQGSGEFVRAHLHQEGAGARRTPTVDIGPTADRPA
jgi:hypothetical protein